MPARVTATRVGFISLGIEGDIPASPVTCTLLGVDNDGLPRSVAVVQADDRDLGRMVGRCLAHSRAHAAVLQR
jgi:hypothetical protein